MWSSTRPHRYEASLMKAADFEVSGSLPLGPILRGGTSACFNMDPFSGCPHSCIHLPIPLLQSFKTPGPSLHSQRHQQACFSGIFQTAAFWLGRVFLNQKFETRFKKFPECVKRVDESRTILDHPYSPDRHTFQQLRPNRSESPFCLRVSNQRLTRSRKSAQPGYWKV